MTAHANSQRGTLIGVAVIIGGGIVAGLLLGRAGDEPAAAGATVLERPASAGAAPVATIAASAPAPAAARVATLTDADLARLADATMTGPRETRLAAIEKLSKAPRAQAIEPLKRVLLNGEPGVDRPAALVGLRELALAQGDPDQRIQDAVREVIYHGDDEAFAVDAQETLDVIARAETNRTP